MDFFLVGGNEHFWVAAAYVTLHTIK